jgi:hypothetical protein
MVVAYFISTDLGHDGGGFYQDKNTIITPWNTVLPHKLTVPQLVKKFPTFYGNRVLITFITLAHPFSQTDTTLSHPVLNYATSFKSILISFSHSHPVLQSGLSFQVSPRTI